jgi:hypothetical protein
MKMASIIPSASNRDAKLTSEIVSVGAENKTVQASCVAQMGLKHWRAVTIDKDVPGALLGGLVSQRASWATVQLQSSSPASCIDVVDTNSPLSETDLDGPHFPCRQDS